MSVDENTEPTSRPDRAQVDSRGPRFGASITAVLLLVTLFLDLTIPASGAAVILLLIIFVLFVYGAIRGVQHHPYGLFFAKVVKPRLKKPAELEDAAAPTFAQGVGAFVTGIGLVLHFAGVPYALFIATAAAFLAAFLNAVFGYCLGCEIYLLLRRAGIIRTKQSA